MNLTTILSALTAIRAALGGLVLAGRTLLLLTALRRRFPSARALPRPAGTATERTIRRVVVAAQLAAAVPAILEWLITAWIIRF